MPHSKKDVREAIQYALENGWTEKPGGNHSHVYCILRCRKSGREGCSFVVNGSPSDPVAHARRVNRCTH